jgi:hypothetical protein
MGIGLNFAGIASGYEGANAAMDNQALQSRLAAQESRAEQDQNFVQYQRDIATGNRTKNLADMADIKAKYDAQNQSAPAQQSSAAAPAATGQANAPDMGTPSPQPLVRAGGLNSPPVNVVSPQSSDGSAQPADSSGQTPAAGVSGAAASGAAPALNADGSINDAALANLGTGAGATQSPTATADGSDSTATAIAVPAPNSADASQTATDSASNAPAVSSGQADSATPAVPANAPAAVDSGPAPATAPGPLTNADPQAAQSTNNQSMLQPAGVPQAHNVNTTLDQQLELINRQVTDGRISPQEYAQSVKNINMMKQEGVHDALDLMATGQYQEAIDKYNSVGLRRGVQLVSAKDGTTMVNGVEQPTKIVTLRSPDGTVSTTDVTQARYQLMSIDQQLAAADKSANTQSVAEYHKYMAVQTSDWHKQQIESTADYRNGVLANVAERNRIDAQNAQAANSLSPSDKLRLQDVQKQAETVNTEISKAQAGGMWDENSAGAKALLTRRSMLNQQTQDIYGRAANGGSSPSTTPDPMGIRGPSSSSANQSPPKLTGNLINITRQQVMAYNDPDMLAQYDREVAADSAAAASANSPVLQRPGGVRGKPVQPPAPITPYIHQGRGAVINPAYQQKVMATNYSDADLIGAPPKYIKIGNGRGSAINPDFVAFMAKKEPQQIN